MKSDGKFDLRNCCLPNGSIFGAARFFGARAFVITGMAFCGIYPRPLYYTANLGTVTVYWPKFLSLGASRLLRKPESTFDLTTVGIFMADSDFVSIHG